MNRKTYLSNVVNKTWNFSKRLKTQQDHELNAITGLAAEAGEVLDILKKKWFHSEKEKDFYREKLILELGDVDYYFTKALDLFDISMKEIRAGNVEKLASRHPELGKVKERFSGNYIR